MHFSSQNYEYFPDSRPQLDSIFVNKVFMKEIHKLFKIFLW